MSYVLWNIAHNRLRELSALQVVRTEEVSLTAGQIIAESEELASALLRAGVHEGSVVCFAMPNSVGFVPAFLALCKLSSIIGLASTKYGIDELNTIIQTLRPNFILTTPEFAKICSASLTIHKTIAISSKNVAQELVLIGFDEGTGINVYNDIAVIKFSSGSTGMLKAIPLTSVNILSECQNIAATMSLTERDGIMVPVPLCHSYGFDLGVLTMLYTGAALTISESFVPRKMLKDISSKNVTVVLGVPMMYRYMAEMTVANVPDLSHIRYLLSCTAPLRPEIIFSFHKKYHVPICQHYGSSETGAVTTHRPAHVREKPDSVGFPMNNVRVMIVDDHGIEQPVGSEGEVVVSSDATARSYLHGMEHERSPFRGGQFWTGDIGVVGHDGYLYLHGRIDSRINVAGLKVSPQEVVNVLERFPAVREAAVLGIKDAMGEEIVYAVVSLKNTISEKEILEHCHRHLAEYKVPRRIEIRDDLPRGPGGKIRIRPQDIHV